jgi:hypothetical protein
MDNSLKDFSIKFPSILIGYNGEANRIEQITTNSFFIIPPLIFIFITRIGEIKILC